MEIKEYKFYRYESILDAIETINEHQEWHIVNVYPSGWRQEVYVPTWDLINPYGLTISHTEKNVEYVL